MEYWGFFWRKSLELALASRKSMLNTYNSTAKWAANLSAPEDGDDAKDEDVDVFGTVPGKNDGSGMMLAECGSIIQTQSDNTDAASPRPSVPASDGHPMLHCQGLRGPEVRDLRVAAPCVRGMSDEVYVHLWVGYQRVCLRGRATGGGERSHSCCVILAGLRMHGWCASPRPRYSYYAYQRRAENTKSVALDVLAVFVTVRHRSRSEIAAVVLAACHSSHLQVSEACICTQCICTLACPCCVHIRLRRRPRQTHRVCASEHLRLSSLPLLPSANSASVRIRTSLWHLHRHPRPRLGQICRFLAASASFPLH